MSYRILMIDDDPWTLSALRTFLTGEGFDVDVADDRTTTYRRLDHAIPDLILLKLTLEAADQGWDLGHELRVQMYGVPIIVLMEGSAPAEKLLAMGLEADAYVKKPYELRSLAEKIDRALQPLAAA